MRRVVIVGGAGQMGRRFKGWMADSGHDVRSLDLANQHEAPSLLAWADLVLLSVPIDRTDAAIAAYAPMLRPDAALADLTSLKEKPLAAMLARHPGPVLGLHPMFGPSVARLRGQKIVVCRGRGPEAWRWLLEWLASQDAALIEATAAEHDRMMLVVQAIRHFATFSLGHFLMSEGVDIGRSLDFASPVYRLEIDMVSRLFAQSPDLYADIMMATPERRAAIGRLARHYALLADLVERGDRQGVVAAFQAASGAFAGEAQRAMAESAALIDALAEKDVGRG